MSSFESYANFAVFAIWVAWMLYWFVSAFGNKAAVRVDGWASFLVYRVPLLVAYMLLFSLAPGLLWPWLAQRFLPHGLAWPCIGLAVLLLGLAFACWARVALGRNWSATVQLKQGHELVTAGPYRWVRHPIYTGMLTGVLGSALVIGEWRGLVALALVLASFSYKLRHEESWMRVQFGDAYVEYMRRTKALIPGVW